MSKISKKITKKENPLKIIRGKSIQLNIKEEGVLEGNVIQIPFIAEYRSKDSPITNIDYKWTTTQDGVKIKRGLRVSGHGKHGVPTLKEKEALRCLHNIFIAQKTEDGVCELKHPDECKSDDYAISFTIQSLCREMGYKSPNGRIRENVKKSLEILVATTIFNSHNGGLYDPEKKEYITNRNIAFHLLETLTQDELLDDNGNVVEDVTRIKLSEFVYRSLYHNYKLIYDKSKVQAIKNLGARTIYQLAMQWSSYGVTHVRVDKLAEHIPMKDGIDMVEKRKYIKRCLKRLEEYSFLSVDINDKNVVTFKFKDIIDKGHDRKIDDMFDTYDEILGGITQLGFTRNRAQSILDGALPNILGVQLSLRQTYTLKLQDAEIDDKSTFLKLLSNKTYEQLTL